MKANFPKFLAFVWPADGDFDSPLQGYHATPGDAGGGTKGGVIEATWAQAVARGLVTGALADATDAQLSTVLEAFCWFPVCDYIPAGLDILIANGRMMTGRYAAIVEQCLGCTGSAVDNEIGPHDQAAILVSDPKTLALALHGSHYQYLSMLGSWSEFGNGWMRRLNAALAAALAVINRKPPPSS